MEKKSIVAKIICDNINKRGVVMTSERIKLILDALSTTSYLSSDFIASKIGISSKTIRNEIKEIANYLKDNGARIDVKQKKGICLIIEDANLYNNFLATLAK